MGDETELYELSSEDNGAKIIFATDDTFGLAENLLKESEPKKYKTKINGYEVMDAWVPRRKRTFSECDFAIIKLATRTIIHFICVDTGFLIGNVALQFSLQASKLSDSYISHPRKRKLGESASSEEWAFVKQYHSELWPHLIPQQSLTPGYSSMNKKYFVIPSGQENYTHVRVNVFPDGGISRLRIYGKVSKPTFMVPSLNMLIDFISRIYGGKCIAYSSCYNNSHPNNLIKPSESINDEDGWQTARSLIRSTECFAYYAPDKFHLKQVFGEEWAIFQLGYKGIIESIILDTSFCVGKGPYVVRMQAIVEGIDLNNKCTVNDQLWREIIPYTVVNVGTKQLIPAREYNINMGYVKLSIKPDGCISRLRVLGKFRILGKI